MIKDSNLKLARRLRNLADKMITQIEEKRNPAVSQQNWTHRRSKIAASMAADADRLEKTQRALYALADMHEQGNVPDILVGVTSKAAVETLLLLRGSWTCWESDQKRMQRAGLQPETIKEAYDTLLALLDLPDRTEERRLRELENKVRGLVGQIPGFFPTPRAIVLQLIELAGIEDGMTVLEPSAGSGAIADVIVEKYPDVRLEVIEWHRTLYEVLVAKGYNVIGDDFFEIDEHRRWDRIIQNPPFENLQDIDHVRWDYQHLTDNGRLVSIMSESPFFRSDKKAVNFREWLDEVGGDVIDLDVGAFADSGTNVKARIVVIDNLY